jgi:hypothetical protein
VLVLSTIAAPERPRLRRRRAIRTSEATTPAAQVNRATAVRAEPFPTPGHAESWLAAVRDQEERREDELARARALIDRALHAFRVAYGDPYARDVGGSLALVSRIGYGSGDDVVAGLFKDAWEQPRTAEPVKRSMEAPEERFAAVLGCRETVLACEELVLRARADIDAGRLRGAALQARIALEALLAELPERLERRRGELDADRAAIGAAANAALVGDLSDERRAAVAACVERMEDAIHAHRLGGLAPRSDDDSGG